MLSADNRHVETITIEQARIRVLTIGGLLDVYGTERRVKYLREKTLARDAKWEPCYRNTNAPALQPSIEWLRKNELKVA